MSDNNKPKFTFVSEAVDKATFHVVKFKGTEGLSTLYRFDITLISEKSDVDLGAILKSPAEFIIKREDGDIPFKGVLSSFEQLHQSGKYFFYRAELVPRLWWTTLTHHNQIFLRKNAQGFLDDVLKDGGLKQGLNHEFKLQESYPNREYVCQYDESHFNFISRWMERDGMYYYFEQTDQGEKMVMTDTHISHQPMAEGTSLTYSPPSNLDHSHHEEVVKNFILKQKPMPKKVLLKDYNYRKPSLELKAEAQISSDGLGEIYIYGEHFQTPGEGKRLATIRAQEFLCREKLFHGISSVPYIRSGYVFELKDHYRHDFNKRYLTTEVVHEGGQEGYLTTGLGLHVSHDGERVYYRNSFTCIPSSVQFRAERKSEKPKFHGSMNAKIDASESGKYAELDDQGRYKVILPMDVSGRKSGKATAWLRMAQPYGGSDHGMHFPLHKGTEVLLTSVDGDPDRPIISATVPNPETPSQVSSANQTQSKITTAGQNKIHIEDKKGSERILMQTPTADTWVRMGAPNDPPAPAAAAADDRHIHSDGVQGYKISTSGWFGITAESEAKLILGHSFSSFGGFVETIVVGNELKTNLLFKEDLVGGLDTLIKVGGSLEFDSAHTQLRGGTLKLQGEVTKLNGDVTKIRGDIKDIKEDHTSLAVDVVRLEDQTAELRVEHDELASDTSKLAGATKKLAGNVDNLCGEVNDVRGAVTKVCGEVSELAGEDNKVVAVYAKFIGDNTKVLGEESTVSAQCNEISGEINEITSFKSTI